MKIRIILWSLTLLFTSSAQATLVQQFRSFSVPNGTVGLDLFAFDPFDSSLGTLDRVTFNIQGTATASAIATPNLLPIGPFGTLQPVAYDYFLRMDMDLFSLAGFNFDFVSDAQFNFLGSNSGSETSITQARQFSLTAEFDEITDFIGFDIPATSNVDIPPISIASSRNDFEENLITSSLGLQFQMLNNWSVVSETGAVAVITPMGSSGGLVTLGYDYTPIPEIPVPGALWLFGTALIGLVGFGKRRKADSLKAH